MKLTEWLHMKQMTEADLARELRISRQAVNYWLKGGRVRPDLAERIEALTGGEVSYRDLTKGTAA